MVKKSGKFSVLAAKRTLSEYCSSEGILGEVVCWDHDGCASSVSYDEIVAALEESGLGARFCNKMHFRNAFSRACRKMSESRVIKKLKDEGDDLMFQFTEETLTRHGDGTQEWSYDTKTVVTLDKETGAISCPVSDLRDIATKELEEAMRVRTSNDITSIVKKVYSECADLIPLKSSGGIYFVPKFFTDINDKVNDFLSKIGRELTRLPVPEGKVHGEKSILKAMKSSMKAMIDDLKKKVSEFGEDTSDIVLNRKAAEIREARFRIESYQTYLKDESEELLEELRGVGKMLTQKSADIAKNAVVETDPEMDDDFDDDEDDHHDQPQEEDLLPAEHGAVPDERADEEECDEPIYVDVKSDLEQEEHSSSTDGETQFP